MPARPTPEEVEAAVRDLGDGVPADGIESRFEAGAPNRAATQAMASAGLLGLTLPERYGGLAADYVALAAACEALARIDLAYQVGLTVHLALSAMTILQWGTEEQRETWLPLLARGEQTATFGLTEPDAGSDVAALRMRATVQADGYRLTGEKTWISCAEEATLYLLFATIDPGARHRGITAFIVPRDTAGLSSVELTGKLGVRAGDTGSVVCDNVLVPPENVLGQPGEGFAVALSALSNGLFTVGCGALGVAAECLHLTKALIQDLDRRGLQAGRRQWIQQHVARMVLGEARARLLLRRAAQLKNRGLPNHQATSLAKWVAADVGRDVAESALTIHQALLPGEHPTIERHLRNVKGAVIYGGTAQIHQTMQAAYALGSRIERPVRRPAPVAPDVDG